MCPLGGASCLFLGLGLTFLLDGENHDCAVYIAAYGQRFLHVVQILFKTFRIRRKGLGAMCEGPYDTQFVLQGLVTLEIQVLISVFFKFCFDILKSGFGMLIIIV